MKTKISPYHIEKQFEKLVSIVEVSVQIEEIRKILSHFINLLKEGSLYEDCYYSALSICENIITQCDVTDRDSSVLCKILNTLLEIVNRDYVSKKVVIESLATVYNIMRNLYHVEVKKIHEMLRAKLPYLSKFFNEMNNFSIMSFIVGIIYEYVYKYDHEERKMILTDVMKDFHDSTAQLTDMLFWPPKLFNSRCRQFLNNIPGRKYFSLPAHSAKFGGKLILPLRDEDYISFEWNTDPMELAFNKFRFATETGTSSEVSVEYNDITNVEIIVTHDEPHVIIHYEKMMAAGVFVDTYELIIYPSDINDMEEITKLISPFVTSTKTLLPKQASEQLCEEIVVRHDKFYNTTDFSNQTLVNDNRRTKHTIQRDATPERALQSIPVDKIQSKENMDEDTDPNFKPFDMRWKLNLIENSTKNKSLQKDPYDIVHMQAEEKQQRQEKNKIAGITKRERSKKSFTAGSRPKSIQSSTPTKRCRSKIMDNVTIDKVDISSIVNISDDDLTDSEKSDATYVPYAMLSKTETCGRGNQKGRKRQSNLSTRVPAKRPQAKINEVNKNSNKTGRKTRTSCGKQVKMNDLTRAPLEESAMQVDDVAVNDTSCRGQDSTLFSTSNRDQSMQPKSKFLCKQLNAKQTTTQTTTKVTTTKTTEVGIGSCTEKGTRNRPTAEMAVQEDVHMVLPTETMAAHATQKVFSLYKVEKHHEYRIQCAVNEHDSETDTLSAGERAQILSLVNKIFEILKPNRQNNIISALD